ncbi:MAG: cytochrome c biogenesis protein CcsA [Planctomycetia bacterium]|nr:cytochrome c biogenesis protein CcsA [Planctomycetia bacterium]
MNKIFGFLKSKMLQFLGSLFLAMLLMSVLAFILGWATFIEREFGTPGAQFLIYSATWFYLLLGLFGVNILCSILNRLPLKCHQIPFLIAHIGIILLLIGCWQTMKNGTEAKMVVSEGLSKNQIVSSSDWILDLSIQDKESEKLISNIVIPFSEGPFSWSDYSFENWQSNICDPSEEKLLSQTLGQKIAKTITKWHHRGVWGLAQFVASPKPHSLNVADYPVKTFSETSSSQEIDLNRNLSIDVLDYQICSDYRSVLPLKLTLKKSRHSTENPHSENHTVQLDFPKDMTQMPTENVSRRGIRKTLPSGERIVFILADSNEECQNFLLTNPSDLSANSLAQIVLSLNGKEQYSIPVAELMNLSQTGSTKLQKRLIELQRKLIQARIDQEKALLTNQLQNQAETSANDSGVVSESSEKDLTVSDESEPKENAEIAVLQTVSEDDLKQLSKNVYDLQQKIYHNRDEISDELSISLGEKRTELLISSEIRQLEQNAKNSGDFIAKMEQILVEIDETQAEVNRLDKICSLGQSGMTITAFQLVPTLIEDVETIKGWTAQIELTNEKGQKDQLWLYSELTDRNIPSRNFGVFGSLWMNLSEQIGKTQFGRKWDETLIEPRLEIIQSPNSEIESLLYYRFWDGKTNVISGQIPLSLSGTSGTSQEISLKTEVSEKTDSSGKELNDISTIESFKIEQFEPNDELGVRLETIPFQKDLANEFYAKVRFRVRWNDKDEIFWIRTIPKESLSPEQEKWFKKTIFGTKNNLKIALTNKTVDLGFSLHIDEFKAVYEPGSTTPASFSSRVHYLPHSDSEKGSPKSVVIQMNQPGRFHDPQNGQTYWVYQDSFRGPFFPGDSDFDCVVQGKLLANETIPRMRLYQTVLSFNNDPGRLWKYCGALFIVLGTALLIYRKSRTQMKSLNSSKQIMSLIVFVLFFLTLPVQARDSSSLNDEIGMSNEPKTSENQESKNDSWLDSLSQDKRNKTDSDSLFEMTEIRLPSQEDWKQWRLLPVFDGGRIMPLNTFAILTVKDICGSSTPTLFLDEKLILDLEAGKFVHLPPFEQFLKESKPKDREFNDAEIEKMKIWFEETKIELGQKHQKMASQIRNLFPQNIRKFDAFELLYYWIVLPEIWDYIPFIKDNNGIVAQNILNHFEKLPFQTINRLAPIQLDQNKDYSKRINAILQQKKTIYASRNLAEIEGKIDLAAAELERRLSLFRALTFNPEQTPSPLVQFYLDQVLYPQAIQKMAKSAIPSSLIEQLDVSVKKTRELLKKETASVGLETKSPWDDPDFFLLKTTPLGKESASEVLLLMRQLNLIAQVYSACPFEMNVKYLDQLFDKVQQTQTQLIQHRNEIFAATQYSEEYRQEIQRLAYLLSEIVSRIELAYLSLTDNGSYSVSKQSNDVRIQEIVDQNGKRSFQTKPGAALHWSENGTMRILPSGSPLPLNHGENRRNPWLSIQTVFYAPELMFNRFVNRGTIPFSSNKMNSEAKNQTANLSDSSQEEKLNNSVSNQDYSLTAFSHSLSNWIGNLRQLAEQADIERSLRYQKQIDLFGYANENPKKLNYPLAGKLNAELLYYQLDAFYWNWFFSLIALFFLIPSLIIGVIVKMSEKTEFQSRQSKNKQTVASELSTQTSTQNVEQTKSISPKRNRRQTSSLAIRLSKSDLQTQNPRFSTDLNIKKTKWQIGEILTFWSGLFFLVLSCSVTFLGGTIRAYITGWAPVTNMFETVVLLAFLIALFTIVYVLRPIFGSPESRNQIFRRKLFLVVGTFLTFLIGLLAYYNSSEFNPNIRPLVAVLRSNFWLTIHVFAIIISYALGSIAWILSLIMLSAYIFGRYPVQKLSSGLSQVKDPEICDRLSPTVLGLLRSSVLFLTLGTLLGGFWADCSWGRFWSWDPKEVWALVTLLIYLVVLHGRRAGYYRQFGLTIGAVFGALAIIMTWYGLSFVLGGGGRHAYTAGESNKTIVLYALVSLNILWTALAVIRYIIQKRKRLAKN